VLIEPLADPGIEPCDLGVDGGDLPGQLSMPDFCAVLAVTFIANTDGDLGAFETADRLASVAGLAPAPYDSGRISGNHHRPRRFNRRLMRTCICWPTPAAAPASSIPNPDRTPSQNRACTALGTAGRPFLITPTPSMIRRCDDYLKPPSYSQ
jgi:hypothetical protein